MWHSAESKDVASAQTTVLYNEFENYTYKTAAGSQWVNSSPPGQNGRRFADDSFRCIFVNEKFCILIKISLTFVPKGPIDNNPALV